MPSTRVSKRGHQAPRWIPPAVPPVLEPPAAAEVPASAPVLPPQETAPRATEHAPDGRSIDWGREETLEKRSAHWFMLWFLIPLVVVILWQLFFDPAGP